MRLLVFDPKLWNGRDVGDNRQFWKAATVLRRYRDNLGRDCVDVQFDHDGRESRGHFFDGTETLVADDDVGGEGGRADDNG